MESILIELLFILLFIVGIGAYIVGKNKHIDLLRTLGVRSSFIMAFMLVVYTFLKWSRDY
ncbi:hypothetical protein J4218_00305 [Candidatus Pacearchaeota archaeon]|nr:hypothetical protein [Candidatus Pacearchaeota archaeon]